MSWQATVVTAAYSYNCEQVVAAVLIFLLWGLWWRRWENSNLCMELDSNFFDLLFFAFILFGLFVLIGFVFSNF
jgi:lysylphosphatidylglycerol synthetase-like protein (DUF2156 family)